MTGIPAMRIRLKRVYDEPHRDDGHRVLVDRMWPRGLSKEKAAVDTWMKEIAPSAGLRKWFGHRSERWEDFRTAYLKELEAHRETLNRLAKQARAGTITLVFAAKNEEHNNAVVIRERLRRLVKKE